MSVARHVLRGPAIVPLRHRERIDWHDHAEHQLVYPIRGVLHVSTSAGAWVVPPNRAVWIPAEVPHAHRAHGPTEMRSLVFARPVDPLGAHQPTVVTVGPLQREVIRTLTGDDGLTARQRYHLQQVALDQLRRVDVLPLCLPTPTDPRLVALTALLHDDPADGRPLRELGRVVGASERTLSRLFREQTGITFPQWRGQLRLHHALELLATGASVTQVATACGYRSASAFIEAFRHAFGETPGKAGRHPRS
jgi:AraC-like DNA-binding protein